MSYADARIEVPTRSALPGINNNFDDLLAVNIGAQTVHAHTVDHMGSLTKRYDMGDHRNKTLWMLGEDFLCLAQVAIRRSPVTRNSQPPTVRLPDSVLAIRDATHSSDVSATQFGSNRARGGADRDAVGNTTYQVNNTV
ncbi:MAG: hypothetical protein ACREL5_08855 [Gemmatimonadales bacterium]